MTPQRGAAVRHGRPGQILPLSLVCALLATSAMAQSAFETPGELPGRFRVTAADPVKAPVAGSTVTVTGSGFAPGQKVTLQQGDTVLNAEPATADERGAVSITFTLPESAVPGLHPVAVLTTGPTAAGLVDVKVSPELPISGTEAFALTAVSLAPGLYQSVYSPGNDALFVTGTTFRPPVTALLKVNPETLEIIAQIEPAALPEDQRPAPTGGQYDFGSQPVGVFGVDVDEAHGTIWTTNTLHNTVAVYAQDDLSLVKQFPYGLVYHARDVIVDETRNRAFVSASASPKIHVFDTAANEHLAEIELTSGIRGKEFSLMSLELDPAGGRLFAVSRLSDELAIVNLDDLSDVKVIPVPGARNAAGVAFDPATGRVLVASQDSDNVVIIDPVSGDVVKDVAVGGGALSVKVEPVSGLAFVSSRTAGTVTVLTLDGEIVANLEGGTYPNHIHADGRGNVYATNKSAGAEDANGDRLTLIRKAN